MCLLLIPLQFIHMCIKINRNAWCTHGRRKKVCLVPWSRTFVKMKLNVCMYGILDVFGRFAYQQGPDKNSLFSKWKTERNKKINPLRLHWITSKSHAGSSEECHWHPLRARFRPLTAFRPFYWLTNRAKLLHIRIPLADVFVSHAPSRSLYANGRISCGRGRQGEA